MGLLVVFFIGIAVIIVIAKMASKMRPEEERVQKKPVTKDQEAIDQDPDPKEMLEALITILTRKEILNPDELLIEIAANRKTRE